MEPYQKKEIIDLAISTLVVAFIFSMVFGLDLFPVLIGVVVISFVFHELAHRFTARKFGYVAFYKMWPLGLAASLLLVAFMRIIGWPIVIIAPGAVVILPYAFGRWKFDAKGAPRELGLIATAGPSVNLFFAIIFSPFAGALLTIPGLIFLVNAFLAFFNLLPIPPLDGSKIILWKSWLWFVLFVTAMFLVFLALGVV
jgi:Zn-dependent protease